ncbi:MAG: serine/threonine-protein kinase [Ruminococcus sp.]|nr:serine/threonine-protein kinase [Ruminococcus sp.]
MAFLGEIIDGKYEILREIGRGGMSIVYLAMDKRLNKQWAIKEFRKDKDDESKRIALEALLREANLMKGLDHPTLPRIVDIIDQDNTVFIVMDYIEGESLNKVLNASGAQPQDAVIEWARQISEVLDYLHTRKPPVIYRDMKPANIMLKPDGTVRLIDFGIAREYKEGQEGDTTSIGTRGYAAPEQFGGQGQTDARTDIYSLGVTLYHLVTGKNPAEPPYKIYPIRHWNPNLSSGLEWLIQKCTQLDPNDRFQSCAEVLYVLDNLEKYDTTYRAKQKKKIRNVVIALICSAVFALGGVAALYLKGADHKQELIRLKSQNTISGYIEAIRYDNTDADSYKQLMDKLDNDIDVIYPGESQTPNTETNHFKRIIYRGELDKALSDANLNALKEISPDTYAWVNYDYGLDLWNNYFPSDDADASKNASGTLEGMLESNLYFERALDTMNANKNNFGINRTQAENYYLLGYFRKNENAMNSDRGVLRVNQLIYDLLKGIGDDKISLEELNEAEGTYTLKNPFYAYWRVLTKTTSYLSNVETSNGTKKNDANSESMTNGVKLTTIYFNVNAVERLNTSLWSSNPNGGTLTPEDIQNFYNTAFDVYDSIRANFDSEGTSTADKRRHQMSVKTAESLNSLHGSMTDYYKKYDKKIKLNDPKIFEEAGEK